MKPGNSLSRSVIICCLFAVISNADADEFFDRGVEVFRNGDFAAAVEFFEQSRDQGNSSPILDYNLGASYFKLGNLERAKYHFSSSAKDKELAGLSYYNLGLLALKSRNTRQAYKYFRQSFDAAQDEKVRILAALKMQELDEYRAQIPESGDRVTGFLSLAVAHDDNVTRSNDDLPAVSNKPDNYLDFFGAANYQIKGDAYRGLQLKAGLIAVRYQELNLYDETLLNLGLYQYRPLGSWYSRLGVAVYHDRLDGAAFQNRLTLQARADRYYASRQRLRLNYDLTFHNDADRRYEYLNGHRHRFSVENRTRLDAFELRLGYRFELNDREDYSFATTRYPYSPERHTLYSAIERDFSPQWSAEFELDYRYSDYNDAAVINGVNQGVRKDRRWRYSLSAAWHYRSDLDFEAAWRYSDNRSSFMSEEYSSNLFMLSANHFF